MPGSSVTTNVPWRDRPSLRETEVAELIGISPRSVKRMVESGELKGRRAGNVRLVLTESLIQWEKGTTAAEATKTTITPGLRQAAAHWHREKFS